MRVTLLGSGPSWGVPRIGGDWGACDPAEPRNRRLRASLLVEEAGRTVLIDTAPDLRQQLLAAGCSRIDAVLYTHAHADHLHGIDELRTLNRLMQKPIPIYGDAMTLSDIAGRFGYVFPPAGSEARANFYRPTLDPVTIAGPFEAAGMAVTPIAQDHGFSRSLGFRFARFAYSTDVLTLDAAAFAALAGIDVWVVDCIRREPHPTHSHLARTLEWIAQVRPRRAILTHMDESLDYRTLGRELPAGVEPGYDGLWFEA